MAQIVVIDAAGVIQTVAKVVNTGSMVGADSLPVALSTEDKALLQDIIDGVGGGGGGGAATEATLAAVLAKLSADPATQTTLAAILAKITADPATQTTLAAVLAKLIAAPATEAKQDVSNVSLASIDGKTLTDIQLRATPVPVSITGGGDASAANQATGNASLASIDGKTPALGQALAAASVPIVLTAAQLTTITPPAAIAGFATETTLAAQSAKLPASLGIKTAAASLSVAPASDALFITTSAVATLVSISGTVTTGATAQNIAAANAARRGFWIQNLSTGDLWLNTLAAAVASQPSLRLAPGAYYETPVAGCGTGAISVLGATTGQAFSAREW